MFSPQEQQVAICLLKSDLDDIKNNIVKQGSTLPILEEDNEQKRREALNALREVRGLSVEIERLKQENTNLTAQLMQLRRTREDLNKALEKEGDNRSEILNLLNHEEQEIDLQINEYIESLQRKSNRFRKARGFYNEEEVIAATGKMNIVINDLQNEIIQHKLIVDDLIQQLDNIGADVPENILAIVGKPELDNKIKALNEKQQDLVKKRNFHLNQKNTTDEIHWKIL